MFDITEVSIQECVERQKRREKIFEKIQQECIRQDMKWGDQSHDDGKWLQILIEELGEASKNSLELDPINARRELVQCAAVLVQWIYDDIRKLRELDND